MVSESDSKKVCCFTFDSDRHFSRENGSNGKVRAAAFMPREIAGRWEKSVVDLEDIGSEEEIWGIGKTVRNLRSDGNKRELTGRCDVGKQVITENNLRIIRDDHPFDRHANILGWPITKPDQTEIASNIAESATFKTPREV